MNLWPFVRRAAAAAALVAAAVVPGPLPEAAAMGAAQVALADIEGTPVGGVSTGGYLLAADDGSVHTFTAASRGSAPPVARPNDRPIVDIAATPSGDGYWLTTTHGDIYSFGDAAFFGSTGNLALNLPIVGMAGTPSGKGYWLVASDGGIFTFGDARFFGSTGDITLNQPIVGMASSTTGNGYWLVAADGGIFTYGDARFRGSTGDIRLNRPIVGMAATPSGAGYWMVASDGGIFSFGDATFLGSTGNITLRRPIVGMSPSPTGRGYWLVASDGGVFTYGDADFRGAMESSLLDGRIVGLVPQGGDVRAPTLRSLTFGPVRVDTSQGEARIRFRARITDDISGNRTTTIVFRSPNGAQSAQADFDARGRVSGTALDGIYEDTLVLPVNSASGRWTVATMGIGDVVGNHVWVEGRTLAEAGYPTSFEQAGVGDDAAPRIRSMTVSPTTIDTSAAPATVTVRVRVTDDWSGVATGSLTVRFTNGLQFQDVPYEAWTLIAGNNVDGTYEAALMIPRNAAAGWWAFDHVLLRDTVGNYRYEFARDLPDADFDDGFRQTGVGDSTTPTLVSFSFTPTVVDTSTQPATITVTARITDAGAGVATSSDDPFDCAVYFISPSQQEALAPLGWWQFVSGDTHDATYRSTFTIPLHSEQGTWQVKQVHLSDRIGNQTNMWTADLAAAGFPTTLDVLRTEDRQERP